MARILFAMGRDGQLPRRVFAAVHARFRTPWLGIVIVGAIGLLGAILLSLDFVASIINFGALVAFSLVNLAVFKTYFIDRRRRGAGAVLKYVVAPGLGLAMTVWLWTSLSVTALITGIVWVAVGFVILLVITRAFRRKPPVMDFSEEVPVVEDGATRG